MGRQDKLSKDKARQAKDHFEKGTSLGQRQRWREAISQFKQAVKIQPDFAQVHQMLALSYGAVMDKEAALKHYEILKQLDKELARQLANTPAFAMLLSGDSILFM